MSPQYYYLQKYWSEMRDKLAPLPRFCPKQREKLHYDRFPPFSHIIYKPTHCDYEQSELYLQYWNIYL